MRHAAVGVTVATLWSSPDRTRPSDAAALLDSPDIGAWIAAMTPTEQTGSGVVTQLLLGDPVQVEESRPDGWSRVVATGQPAPELDPRGYPGWVRTAQLTAPASDGAEPLVVDATTTALRDAPGGRVVLPGVVLGTRLPPVGAAAGSWLPVGVAGRTLWAAADDLAPVPDRPPTGDEVLAVARRLLGAVYVWGGLSTPGIDCSGLVHLVWRRLGVRLPRDAHDQAAATTPVAPGTEHPGDLYFFARPGRPVHHVGIVVTPTDRVLLHASAEAHQVLEEPMPQDRVETLTGIHRVGQPATR
ncbi:NlpC/P60 family protein [Dactylosporangium siamense]|uniref:Peptidase P60 n=1 Tax=Dactylosporangium siamense TaxID=685454 RepID=A0A919UB19_9ACTN|nr:NlpC/P60 family protein [Dactylosporangium siamense]GIG45116.1 peptidase P60 [Dactylosporangium siamense]